MMLSGMGDTPATTGNTAAPPTFVQGLEVWKSPSAGFTALKGIFSNASVAFSGTNMPAALGVIAVPVALVAILFSVGGKR